jgi:hypothetical protein
VESWDLDWDLLKVKVPSNKPLEPSPNEGGREGGRVAREGPGRGAGQAGRWRAARRRPRATRKRLRPGLVHQIEEEELQKV